MTEIMSAMPENQVQVLKHLEMRGMRSRLELFEAIRLICAVIEDYIETMSVGYLFRQVSDVKCCMVRTLRCIYGDEISITDALRFYHATAAESVRRSLMGAESVEAAEKVRRTVRRMAAVEQTVHVSDVSRLIGVGMIAVIDVPEGGLKDWVSDEYNQLMRDNHTLMFELSTIITGAERENAYHQDLEQFWRDHGISEAAENNEHNATEEDGEHGEEHQG